MAWLYPSDHISFSSSDLSYFLHYSLMQLLDIVTAWNISSKLAIQLANRFPQGKMQKFLQELILAEPTRALEIPDALQILVTEDTVRANIPELSIPSQLIISLQIFHNTRNAFILDSCTSASRTLLPRESLPIPSVGDAVSILKMGGVRDMLWPRKRYAIRVLQSFSSDTIIFYLPQLVSSFYSSLMNSLISLHRYKPFGMIKQTSLKPIYWMLPHEANFWPISLYPHQLPTYVHLPITIPGIQYIAYSLHHVLGIRSESWILIDMELADIHRDWPNGSQREITERRIHTEVHPPPWSCTGVNGSSLVAPLPRRIRLFQQLHSSFWQVVEDWWYYTCPSLYLCVRTNSFFSLTAQRHVEGWSPSAACG